MNETPMELLVHLVDGGSFTMEPPTGTEPNEDARRILEQRRAAIQRHEDGIVTFHAASQVTKITVQPKGTDANKPRARKKTP